MIHIITVTETKFLTQILHPFLQLLQTAKNNAD